MTKHTFRYADETFTVLRHIKRGKGWRTLVVLPLLIFGCAAQKPKAAVPAPDMPPHATCGARVIFEFEDDKHQETWVYPCWPESHYQKPYCVKGCVLQSKDKN
jgi:hypothetical protein